MAKIGDILRRMRTVPHDVPFDDVAKVCKHYFGEARQEGTSHKVYKMLWPGDPRVNIQKSKNGKAKDRQVRKVIQTVKKLEPLQASDEGDDA